MTRMISLAVIGVAVGLACCGNPPAPDKTRPAQAPVDGGKVRRQVAAADSNAAADILRLSEVRLSPAKPTAVDDLVAEPLIAQAVPEEVDFQYRWFIDNRELEDASDAILPCVRFRKQQWVYCQSMARAGDQVSAWLNSKWVHIANSAPQVAAAVVGNFDVPGKFRFQIAARDVDNDELTYKLDAPLDLGIELDARSGLLTWTIDAAMSERLGEKVEIKFTVSDNDKGQTSAFITINLTKAQ